MGDISTWGPTLWAVIWGAITWVYWTIDTLIFSLPILGPFFETGFWIAVAFAVYRFTPQWARPLFSWIGARLRWVFGPILETIWRPIQRAIIRRTTGIDVGATETEKDHLIQQLRQQTGDLENQIAKLKAAPPGTKIIKKMTLAGRAKWMSIGGALGATFSWWGPVVWPVVKKIPTIFG